jgi:hypothetical protein
MIKFDTSEMLTVADSFLSKVREKLGAMSLEDMCAYGDELMNKAYNERKWQNRTFNLSDSFGWVVYNNGLEYKRGYIGDAKAKGSKKIYGEEMRGREVLDSFIINYEASKTEAELVIVAAMPYGLWLETRYNYAVLSSIKDDLSRAFNQPVKEIR